MALLAAGEDEPAERGLRWIAGMQRPDGGWPPQAAVDQSTWVTALAALLPPERLGARTHARAIRWLVGTIGEESGVLYRMREWLLGLSVLPEERLAGWPWVPGSAGWVGPTSLAILALEGESRRSGAVASARTHRRGTPVSSSSHVREGGWNHGWVRPLGYDTNPYPETTGMALAALRGTRSSRIDLSLELAKKYLSQCRSADALNWLRLGLLAHGQLPEGLLPAGGDRLPHRAGDIARHPGRRGRGRKPAVVGVSSMTHRITRREWLASAAGLAAVGCSRRVRIVPSAVSIVSAPSYDQRLYETVRRIFEEHRLDVRGRHVVLKPNMVEFEPDSSINTNPLLVHAALEAVRSMGAAGVRIAEGPGHRRNTLDLADAAGYFRTVPGFEDLFIDLNLDDVTRVRLGRQFSGLSKLYLPNTALGADLLVSMPKMKTHHWVGATLSMKNLFGMVPGGVYGWPKNLLHWAGIEECIADLHSAFPRTSSPSLTESSGWRATGRSRECPKTSECWWPDAMPVAVDATCCRLMRIDPFRIGYLRLASGNQASHITATNIRQIGESIPAFATPFELPPGFPDIRTETS